MGTPWGAHFKILRAATAETLKTGTYGARF